MSSNLLANPQSSVAMVQSRKYLLAPSLRLKVKHPASSAKTNLLAMVKKSQIDKFREMARALETDEDKLNAVLKKVFKGD